MAVSMRHHVGPPQATATVVRRASDDLWAPVLLQWQALRAEVPGLRRLTCHLPELPAADAAGMRRAVLDHLGALPQPADGELTALGFDVMATGTSPLFAEALGLAAAGARRSLVLALPPAGRGGDAAACDRLAVDAVRRLAEALQSRCDATATLGTRWERSVDDARWAAERAQPVRLVPGCAPDPRQPQRAPAAGLLAMVRLLAGRVPSVTLAWPDACTAMPALRLLRASATACELELPSDLRCMRPLRQAAQQFGVPVRLSCELPRPPLAAS